MGIGFERDCRKYYIGVRKSDVAFAEEYFAKSFCLFFPNARKAIEKRPNQNIKREDLQEYLNEKTVAQYFADPKGRFVFYNQSSV